MTNYFKDRQERREHAIKWTRKMDTEFSGEIKTCINKTKTYSDVFIPSATNGSYKPEVVIEDADSVSAVFAHQNDGKMCVLNFASYKNPGGMFIEGSSAQEECLCHESFLYSVLKERMYYYVSNRNNLNKGLYTNKALLSPNVLFIRDDIVKCDVLTCAAPNRSLIKYGNFTEEENSKVLEDRIKFVCDILKENEYSTVILGAYGCGVFAQNPTEVAKLFDKYLVNFNKPTKAVFAIPTGDNLEAFKNYFNKGE